jgi:metal-responsive CopG/Arc/MetJ family transcriptional regulator
MKAKTSITLPQDLIAEIDRLAGSAKNRSAVIERAIRGLIALEARRLRDARDREILDKHAGRLNREAADVLSYQSSYPHAMVSPLRSGWVSLKD